jgi:integrase
MASIHKRPNTANWFVSFCLPDGRRALRSTGTPNKRQAMAVAVKYEEAAQLAAKDRLSETRARQVISDIYAMKAAEKLPSDTLADYLDAWLKRKGLEIAESSYLEYQRAAEELRDFFGARAQKPLESVTRREAVAFRDRLAKRVAPATANKYLKIARVLWNNAWRDGLVSDNPFAKTEALKSVRSIRRPFSLPELKRVLAICDDDWRGVILCGLYTGQRLADIAGLTWAQVDLEQKEIHFHTRKTGRDVHTPIAEPLQKYLLTRAGVDDATAPLFPAAAGVGSSILSRHFNDILAVAGLVPKRSHQASKQGRSSRRETSALSFHCLRHTATSLLKNAGVSDVVAREIIGHDSVAVSRQYTHIETDTLRAAMAKMPDVTT